MARTASATLRKGSPASQRLPRDPKSPAEIHWRDRPYQQLGAASEITQISEAALYKAEKEGELTFVRLAGRTLVETASLIAFLDRAQPWTPSDRGAAARARRIEVARAALRP